MGAISALGEFLWGHGASRNGSLWWPHYKRQQGRNRHDAGDDMKGAAIGTGCLTHVCHDQRTDRAGKTPGGQHQSVDRTDILRTKIISGKRGHCAEPAAVTH